MILLDSHVCPLLVCEVTIACCDLYMTQMRLLCTSTYIMTCMYETALFLIEYQSVGQK